MSGAAPDAIRVFISYAHKDRAWLDKLRTHLGWYEQGEDVAFWNDAYIRAGDEFDKEIKRDLVTADLVLALVSADFGASSYIVKNELAPALARHELSEAAFVPILVRPCVWKRMPFAKLEMLPKDENEQLVAVSLWENEDVVFTRIAERIGEVIDALRARKRQKREEAQQTEKLEQASAATGIDLALYLKRARYRWETVDLTTLAPAGPDEVRPTLARVFVPQDCRRARPPQTVLRDWLREQGLDPDREEAKRDLLLQR